MKIKKLTEEQFKSFYVSLKIPSRYSEESLFLITSEFFDSINSQNTSKVLDLFNNLNPYQLALYLISEIIYFTEELSDDDLKVRLDDEKFVEIMMSSSLDKYLTNEKINLDDPLFVSKFSPSISTLRTYLNFMTKILKMYKGNLPRETLINDYLLKAVNISRCCLDLLEDGFESEAFSTWRTLHETECILSLFVKYGQPIIEAYLKHMNYSIAFRKMIPSVEETDKVFVQIKDEMKSLDLKSKDMKKYIEYGYLSAIPNVKLDVDYKFNFRDGVEKFAGLSEYSELYEYSSEIAHSSPLMIYSNQQMLFHLTLVLLYEVFFRIEKVFASIYLSSIDKTLADNYKMMQNLYYSQMIFIYKKENAKYQTIAHPKK
jgi:hypothetical protein